MENIPGLMFIYGASVIASIMMIRDMVKKFDTKAHSHWIAITLLSLFQVGCWRGLSSLGGAFGNSTSLAIYEILFILLFIAWAIVQLINHNKE